MYMAHGQVRRTKDGTHVEQRLASSSKLLSDGTAIAPRFYVTDANSGQLLYDYDLQHKTFTSQPTTPYEKGDMWTNGTDLFVCIWTRGTGAFDSSDWELATDYSSDALAKEAKELAESATKGLANYVTSNDKVVAGLQSQIDGSVSTWFYAYVPSATNEPTSGWTDDATRNEHLGDLFYDTSTGYCYRYMLDGTTYAWSRITDTDVTTALASAAKAQDTADSKRRVFVEQPTPPYDVGDMWVQGSTGDILRCLTSKAAGTSYAATDWVLASKYTDDAVAEEAKRLAASKAVNFVSDTLPSPPYSVGDTWTNIGANTVSTCVTARADGETALDSDWKLSGKAGADAILVCVVSSEGEAFKNNEVSTTLDVTIFHGAKSVTTKEQLVAEFSSAYYLRWWYRARGATGYSELSSTDPRLSNDGFTLSVSPKDVDQQTIFRCTLDDGK